jgi:hypothetical protein
MDKIFLLYALLSYFVMGIICAWAAIVYAMLNWMDNYETRKNQYVFLFGLWMWSPLTLPIGLAYLVWGRIRLYIKGR